MKKKYVKPAAFVEGFEVSSHIATCVWDFNNNVDENQCYAEYNSDKIDGAMLPIFNKGVYGCMVLADEIGFGGINNNDICIFVGGDDGYSLIHNS